MVLTVVAVAAGVLTTSRGGRVDPIIASGESIRVR